MQNYFRPPKLSIWSAELYLPFPWLKMLRFPVDYLLNFLGSLKASAEMVARIEDQDEEMPDDFRSSVVNELGELAEACNQASLLTSRRYVERIRNRIEASKLTGRELGQIWQSIPDVITTEAGERQIFIIPHENAEMFLSEFPFGNEVHAHFPSASHEIKEAGKCLALDRNTACVMHLMRALEVGLGVLAKELKVPCQRKSWEKIINKISKRIEEIERKMPKPRKWPEKRQFYSETAERFALLKDAFRNEAMHQNQTYGREQAKDIYGYAKAFMGTLAKRLREKSIV